MKTMETAVAELKYDSRKAPLGKLSKDQIKAGYSALSKISDCISEIEKLKNAKGDVSTTGKGRGKAKKQAKSDCVADLKQLEQQILEHCNNYYTRIPHTFG